MWQIIKCLVRTLTKCMVVEVNSTNVFLTPVETVAEDQTDRQTVSLLTCQLL